MSWIVQRLLIEKLKLKENPDFESDDYNDLLLIEKALKNLREKNQITSLEYIIVDYIAEGYQVEDIEKFVGIRRQTIARIYKDVCNRIAFYLGGSFTDDGLIEDLRKEYNLSKEQVANLDDYMHSKYRHKLSRRSNVE